MFLCKLHLLTPLGLQGPPQTHSAVLVNVFLPIFNLICASWFLMPKFWHSQLKSIYRYILYMWINNLYVDIVPEGQTLRPLENMLVASHGIRQENCAGSWWLPRAGGGCWTVHVLWGKRRSLGVSSSIKRTNINLLVNSCLRKWRTQLFHVSMYSLMSRICALVSNFCVLKVCHIIERKMFIYPLKEDEADNFNQKHSWTHLTLPN